MRFQDTPFSAAIQNNGRTIFVFGSNLAGRHGKGAALTARLFWGAVPGKGIGYYGQSYAIPTKDEVLGVRPLYLIEDDIKTFLMVAMLTEESTFLVTRIGCGLAGYKDSQIAPMFKTAPDNCVFQKEWEPYLI